MNSVIHTAQVFFVMGVWGGQEYWWPHSEEFLFCVDSDEELEAVVTAKAIEICGEGITVQRNGDFYGIVLPGKDSPSIKIAL